MSDLQAAQDDLAYLRTLVDGGGRPPAYFGKAMLSGGLLHGALVLLYAAHFAGIFVLPPVAALHIVLPFAPSLVWVAYLGWIGRGADRRAPSGVHKPINAAFQGVGLVSVTLLPVFGLVAWRNSELSLLFLHAVVVFAVLGAAWYVAFRLTRRAWMGWTMLGWLTSAVLMGLAVAWSSLAAIFAVAAIPLFALMALPGWVMLRASRAPAAA